MVGRGFHALQAAEAAGVALVLAGHLHLGFSGDVRAHHLSIRRSMLVAQAGTAISLRTRDEPNTYNWITFEAPHLTIEVRGWAAGAFSTLSLTRWRKRDTGWEKGSP